MTRAGTSLARRQGRGRFEADERSRQSMLRFIALVPRIQMLAS